MIDNSTQIPITLQCEGHVKYLGVLLDSNLSSKFQINNVALKISRTVGVVAPLRHFVPCTTLLNIYQSLVLPYLTYGLAASGQAAKTYLQKILVQGGRSNFPYILLNEIQTMFSQLAKRSARSCERICVLIMCTTSKSIDQRSWEETKTWRSKAGLFLTIIFW